MRIKLVVLIVANLLLGMTAGMADTTDDTLVTYIGTNNYKPTNTGVFSESNGYLLNVFNLDAKLNLQNTLSKNLPSDTEKATKIVKERFNKIPADELKNLFAAQLSVKKWNLEKAPAWVFNNGEAVVYGVTDAREAFKYWHKWRAGQ